MQKEGGFKNMQTGPRPLNQGVTEERQQSLSQGHPVVLGEERHADTRGLIKAPRCTIFR